MNNQSSFVEEMLNIQEIAKKSKVPVKFRFNIALKERYDQAVADAQPIIAGIKVLAQAAAADNQDGCSVMYLKPGDDEYFSDYISQSTNGLKSNDDLPEKALGVTAKTVFNYCKNELKIATRVKQSITSYDERGMTYFKIWIYWKPKVTTRAI